MLSRQRAIELVPCGEPLGWRRYDVPQHLAPEASDALRFCAVEGDLELLDRRHRSTIKGNPAIAARVGVRVTWARSAADEDACPAVTFGGLQGRAIRCRRRPVSY